MTVFLEDSEPSNPRTRSPDRSNRVPQQEKCQQDATILQRLNVQHSPQTFLEIQSWLTEHLALMLEIEPSELDIQSRFSDCGLDSARATNLILDLATALGRQLSPTLIWDFPTIEALANHLAGTEQKQTARTNRKPQKSETEAIAIVGIACRFPGANSPSAFWQLLQSGADAVTEVPPNRWDINAFYDPDSSVPGKMNTRWGGFLERIDQFDAQFFSISPREAVQMDPQQRLALKVSWEALEDAGLPVETLKGSSTGVFVGAMWADYGRLQKIGAIAQHTATGQDLSIIANRISYTFGFQGPSMTVNTACSSSLVAVHLACQSLRCGECTAAIAGGVNLIINPDSTVAMSKFGGLSPDGRCKAFDASANGYVRGEGAGVVVLKLLSEALAAGDRIYCLIEGSAVNSDGFSNGLTAPSPQAQAALLRETYDRAGIRPNQVHYVETHGTGTRLGDPIEAKALADVLGCDRFPESPLIK
jgi:acyl transferase domain-containing protein/acyl carrier protein